MSGSEEEGEEKLRPFVDVVVEALEGRGSDKEEGERKVGGDGEAGMWRMGGGC